MRYYHRFSAFSFQFLITTLFYAAFSKIAIAVAEVGETAGTVVSSVGKYLGNISAWMRKIWLWVTMEDIRVLADVHIWTRVNILLPIHIMWMWEHVLYKVGLGVCVCVCVCVCFAVVC